MPMSPEKIIMYSLPESEPDLAFPYPVLTQNEEDVRSNEISPVNPASPFGNPNPPPNQEAHCDETPSGDPSPSLGKNPNPSIIKEPVEKPLENPVTCSENETDGAEKRIPSPQVEGEAGMVSAKDKTKAAASTVARKLPAWASNQRAEDEKGRGGKSENQTEKKGNDLPLPNNLQQVIEAFSGDFDWKRYSEMDLLEVAEIKGVVFENPSWWPPESFPDSL